MKKIYRILAAVAIVPMAASLMAASCVNVDPDDKDEEEVVLEEPALEEFATAGVVAAYQTTNVRRLVSYDFNGSGTATLGFKMVDEIRTRAEAETPDFYEVYPYTASAGAGEAVNYQIEGFGTIAIELTQEGGTATAVITIMENNQEVVENVPAVVPSAAAVTTFSANICRDWKVKELFVEATGDDIKQTIGRRFTSGDLNEILKYVSEKGINVNSNQLKYQMNVDVIKISKFGSITIKFGATAVAEYKEYPIHDPYVVSINPSNLESPEQDLGNILKEYVKDVTFKEGSSTTLKVTADGNATIKVVANIEDKNGKKYMITVEGVFEQA